MQRATPTSGTWKCICLHISWASDSTSLFWRIWQSLTHACTLRQIFLLSPSGSAAVEWESPIISTRVNELTHRRAKRSNIPAIFVIWILNNSPQQLGELRFILLAPPRCAPPPLGTYATVALITASPVTDSSLPNIRSIWAREPSHYEVAGYLPSRCLYCFQAGHPREPADQTFPRDCVGERTDCSTARRFVFSFTSTEADSRPLESSRSKFAWHKRRAEAHFYTEKTQ